MKKIYVVIDKIMDGKHHVFADTIRTGENLVTYIDRFNCDICHLCESRIEAEKIALEWNKIYNAEGDKL